MNHKSSNTKQLRLENETLSGSSNFWISDGTKCKLGPWLIIIEYLVDTAWYSVRFVTEPLTNSWMALRSRVEVFSFLVWVLRFRAECFFIWFSSIRIVDYSFSGVFFPSFPQGLFNSPYLSCFTFAWVYALFTHFWSVKLFRALCDSFSSLLCFQALWIDFVLKVYFVIWRFECRWILNLNRVFFKVLVRVLFLFNINECTLVK